MNPLIKLTLGMGLFFVAVAIFLSIKLNQQNAPIFQAYGTILAVCVGIPALFFVGIQAMQLKKSVDFQKDELVELKKSGKLQRKQIEEQMEAFHLERRPYLYIELRNLAVWKNPNEKAWFGGGDIYFKNVGEDPATIVQSQYMACSDVSRDCTEFQDWFENAFAGFPEIKTVMHGQENLRVAAHPILGPSDKQPKLLYVGAVISYVGPKKGRKYWYKYAQLFVVQSETIRPNGGGEVVKKLSPGKAETDWDRNENTDPPMLQPPDWDNYLERSYVKTVTQKDK